MQQFLNGLTLGGIYALIALGYTMVYGIVKLINFAHGDIFMLGAFMGLMVASQFTNNFFIIVIVAMAICAVVGLLVEKTAYRPLRESKPKNMIFTAVVVVLILAVAFISKTSVANLFDNPSIFIGLAVFIVFTAWLVRGRLKSSNKGGSSRINALISAIGMSIIISNMVALIRGPQRATYPEVISLGNITFGTITISMLQIFIILSSLVLMCILYVVVHKTKAGVAMRAVSQNADAARLMGINPNKIIAFTFAMGSALAAAAGVLVGVYYTVADPTMGNMYGLKAFVAAVLGGIGSIPGAMVGGVILGVAEVFGVAFIAPSFRDAIAFGILILILIVKPSGIFGSKAKEKV
ncbi:MAG: branched-chain amino acid ABC transporter permease [Deferribacteraceae bacterium]|nr:branched-chain amino acid ABC transporter permease [Deferribacteraceae bacterium]